MKHCATVHNSLVDHLYALWIDCSLQFIRVEISRSATFPAKISSSKNFLLTNSGTRPNFHRATYRVSQQKLTHFVLANCGNLRLSLPDHKWILVVSSCCGLLWYIAVLRQRPTRFKKRGSRSLEAKFESTNFFPGEIVSNSWKFMLAKNFPF